VYGPEPKISAVVNAASYGASTVSPGEIIVIYGMALGPVDVVPFNSTAPPPLTLGANGAVTAVKIDGLDAPILYTSGTQISCIVPYGVSSSSGNDVDLVVTYNSLPSDPFTVTVADADPGVFVDSTGQAAIMNVADTGAMTMNTAKNAAAKGSAVSIYITGFGDTQCADTQTSTCPVTHPDEKAFILGTVTPTGNVGVTIGGQAATVLAAIAPEGSVAGLLQINVTVPDGAPTGAAVAVVVSVGSANSSKQTVTMAVK
jgi:uncharacterized protein (TIGR03437 family)